MRFTQSTEPESSNQLILRSLDLYRRAFLHVFFLALALSFIVFTPRLVALLAGQDIFENISMYNPHKLWLVLINFCALIFFTALLWRVRCVMKHQHESLLDDFSVALRKIIYIVVATILENLLILFIIFFSVIFIYFFVFSGQQNSITTDMPTLTIMFILFVLQLSVIFLIFFLLYFYLPIIVVENKKIIESLKKSAHLVWHHLSQTIWVQMTPWLIYLMTLIVIKYVFKIDLHIYFMGPQLPTVISSLVHIVLFALFIPWVASTMLVQLHDLELRSELIVTPKKHHIKK